MVRHVRSNADKRRDQQEELADSLVDCMGRDSAIHVCKLNGWCEVLDLILDGAPEPGDGVPGAPAGVERT